MRLTLQTLSENMKALAKRFALFPCKPDKSPAIKGWQHKATRDPEQIDQWASKGWRAFAIPCGAENGLSVIDLDVDKETSQRVGEASLKALPRYAPLLDMTNVATPSGGSHIYCEHFDGARNTQNKIGLKIDTRGQGGYVIAPGSETEGGLYRGEIPAVLPAVPMGLRALLLHQPPTPSQNRSFGRETPTTEVEALLGHIPPDLCYGEWLAVLMGLHDRYSGSDEGLALADRWSAGGAKYRKGEVLAKWRSFKRNGVSWATVPALARQHGADLSAIARGLLQ